MKRKKGTTDHSGPSYLKSGTAGKSNEITFSVLEAASRKDKNVSGSKASAANDTLGEISLFTLPNVKKSVGTPKKGSGLSLPSIEAAASIASRQQSAKGDSGEVSSASEKDGKGASVESGTSQDMASSQSTEESRANLSERASRLEQVSKIDFDTGNRLMPDQSVAQNRARLQEAANSSIVSGMSPRIVETMQDSSKGAPAPAMTRGIEVLSSDSLSGKKGGRRAGRQGKKLPKGLLVAIIVAICAVVAALGAIGISRLLANHEESVNSVEKSLRAIEEVDDVMVEMDSLLAQPFEEVDAQKAKKTLEGLSGIEKKLDEAEQATQEALKGVLSSNEKEAMDNALVSVEKRHRMLVNGRSLLSTIVEVNEAINAYNEASVHLASADAFARESASKVVGDATPEMLEASNEAARQAIDEFARAEARAAQIENAPNMSGIEALISYSNLRIEALEHAIASNDALIEEDVALAQSENEQYNKLDAQASQQASQSLNDYQKTLWDEARKKMESSTADYEEARSAAASADLFLRQYLKTNG